MTIAFAIATTNIHKYCMHVYYQPGKSHKVIQALSIDQRTVLCKQLKCSDSSDISILFNRYWGVSRFGDTPQGVRKPLRTTLGRS